MPEAGIHVSLEVGGLSLTCGTAAFGPIDFTLPRPGCWWLTGASGAGKSLLLESLAGFHAESKGSIHVSVGARRRDVARLAPEHRSIALMPQRWSLFPHWSVARNLRFAARLSASPATRIDTFARKLRVEGLTGRTPNALSGGETQRVALIQTLLSPARVLLLDEPLSAIDAALQSVVLDLLQQEVAGQQRICLIAAHRAAPGFPLQGTLLIQSGRLVPSAAAI